MRQDITHAGRISPYIYGVFLFSGFSAILYQLIWQRALFEIYGTTIESVTVIVTAFMLGLGFGSLLGGRISKNPRRSLVYLFGTFEIGIGIFGIFSLRIFNWVGSFPMMLSTAGTGIIAFLLVLVPTLMMGATLPMLVAHFAIRLGNVGRTVGVLYFINTLGAGIGCLAAAVYLFLHLGQSGTVLFAAGLNLLVGCTVLFKESSGAS